MQLRGPLNKCQTGLSTTLSNNEPLQNQRVKFKKKNTLKSDFFTHNFQCLSLLFIPNTLYYHFQYFCINFRLIIIFSCAKFQVSTPLRTNTARKKWRLTLYCGNIAAIKSSFKFIRLLENYTACQSFFFPNPSSSF